MHFSLIIYNTFIFIFFYFSTRFRHLRKKIIYILAKLAISAKFCISSFFIIIIKYANIFLIFFSALYNFVFLFILYEQCLSKKKFYFAYYIPSITNSSKSPFRHLRCRIYHDFKV